MADILATRKRKGEDGQRERKVGKEFFHTLAHVRDQVPLLKAWNSQKFSAFASRSPQPRQISKRLSGRIQRGDQLGGIPVETRGRGM